MTYDKILTPRRVMMEQNRKIEKMEDRLRAVEDASIQAAAAMTNIAGTLHEMKAMFLESIKDSKALERRVDNVELVQKEISTKIIGVEKAQDDFKKIGMRVAAAALIALLSLAGIKNVPLDAILPEGVGQVVKVVE